MQGVNALAKHATDHAKTQWVVAPDTVLNWFDASYEIAYERLNNSK